MESSTSYLRRLQEQGIRLPAILCQIRTVEGRIAQSKGLDIFKGKFLTPRTDRMCNTLTGVTKDNLIMTLTDNRPQLTYHPEPTKEDLLEYFGQRIRVRKMVPTEAFRLQGVRNPDIEKIQAWPYASLEERERAIAVANKKELNRIKRESICKTAQFKLAGNSIDCKTLYHLFRTAFIPGQPENGHVEGASGKRLYQMNIFDILTSTSNE